jgi:TonB-dependent starch-binding outer membrane protein SusC
MRHKLLLYCVVWLGSLSPLSTQGRQMRGHSPGRTSEGLFSTSTIGKRPKQVLEKDLFQPAKASQTLVDERLISGTITDEKGATLPGVSVLLKGNGPTSRQRGVVTDARGMFQVTVPDGATLVISFVGYLTQEVAVGNRTTITIQLAPDTKALEEVIVVGYGTQRKIETTGAIASVKAADLLQTPVANVAQGLQARVAGVQITQNSGAPGGNVSVRIRGTNSINGSSEPLYVIDGIQIANSGGITDVSPLSQINPNDIESIEVLKDASSTAIYGARAANGVVLITTKRGKDGATRVSYDGCTQRPPVCPARKRSLQTLHLRRPVECG